MVRENADALREGMRRRGKLDQFAPLVDRAQELDRERRATIQAVEERKAARNSASQEVGRRKKAGENADELMASTRALGEEITRLESELATSQGELDAILLEFPNITAPDVPEGDETANVVARSWGTPMAAGTVRPHWGSAKPSASSTSPVAPRFPDRDSSCIVAWARGSNVHCSTSCSTCTPSSTGTRKPGSRSS